ncbi:hypothetical protein SAMN03080603_01279 [Acetomicrobium thermoterrenum DSM 13490]|uniref:Uncharacterized protein n=1 Tax=Acetomicrobium thermoterrenum DSM 13490 TaxID=1120987 RepID=A0A1H3FXR3_9BACT|nr:hypothetical protein [Acetomicrobium thermoterrenum]SDX95862.1 hypothetical protein SAMN03080603_01279 [Acetomicrobium thermoterrenum DSM 13490]
MRILIVTAKEDTERPDVLDTLTVRYMVAKALASVGHKTYVLGVTKKDLRSFDVLENKIKRFRPDCIFNLFEGFSDDSKKEVLFATFLESLNIPFTGNGSAALQASLDNCSKEAGCSLSRKSLKEKSEGISGWRKKRNPKTPLMPNAPSPQARTNRLATN